MKVTRIINARLHEFRCWECRVSWRSWAARWWTETRPTSPGDADLIDSTPTRYRKNPDTGRWELRSPSGGGV